MQQGMVVASAREPASGNFVLQLLCTLREEVDADLMREAWGRVTRRHPMLRSTVHLEAEGLFQVVHDDLAPPFTVEDWTARPVDADGQRMATLLRSDRLAGFDFARGPLQRVVLIRQGAAEHRLLWTCHHALVDRYACVLVLKEVLGCYDALRERRAWAPPPAVTFAEHARWLREQDWDRGASLWRRYLRGFREPVRLPIDRNSGGGVDPADRHGRQVVTLPAALNGALLALARSEGVTLNTLVQGAWAILLARYCGRRDVAFGAIRRCRNSSISGADTIVGPLINTVPVRAVVDPDATLANWLAELRTNWVALREHEHTPLALVHGWSEVPAEASLFESVIVFNRDSARLAYGNLGADAGRRTVEGMQRTDTPLSLFGYSEPELALGIAYDRCRFDPEAIGRMLGHLRTLLEGFVSAPRGRLADLPMLTDAERRQLEAWNDTTRPYPRDACAQTLFERRAQASPAHPAMVLGDRTLSYGEASARANRLARQLVRLGVGPERLAGVHLEHSPDAVVALLAILKAGGAFVMLDPEAPSERLQQVLNDARPAAVITRRDLARRLGRTDLQLVVLEDEGERIAAESGENFACRATAENLAYAVYTSGTTGQPKGVLVTHRSLVNHTVWAGEHHAVTPGDRRLMFAPLSSDVFVAEVFTYLSSGATLVFGFRPAAASIADYLGFVDRNQVTIVGLPASYWNGWVANMADSAPVIPRSLRLVVSGMEQVSPASFATWQRLVGERLAWRNAYGPSETTCTAAIFDAVPGGSRRDAVPIGRPIANARIHLLDPDRNLVPVGVPGELYIGGDGVARGYLNDPGLTAARFVADPFSADGTGKLYRTGDLGVRLPDGDVVFMGRLDDQVKIRGHRVELGDVESVLSRHPDVRQCAVACAGEGPAARLNAYIVLNPGRSPTEQDLRRFVAAQLQRHMVPTAFARFDQLPLTVAGKVDRNRLPSLEEDHRLHSGDRAEPRTDAERRIADIVDAAFGRGRIGVDTDFFDIGGDSLFAVQLAGRIQAAFGVEIAMPDLFAHPTVAGLARLVEQTRRNCERAPAGPRRTGRTEGPLSPAQARMWFLQRLAPASVAYHDMRLWRIEGDVDAEALCKALSAVSRRQPMLRTRFVPGPDGPVQVVDACTSIALESVDLTRAGADAERKLEEAVRERAERPFDLAAAPPIRLTLFDLGGGRWAFAIVSHHILGDAQSARILRRELSGAYAAMRAERDPALPELSVEFADYAAWQAEDLAGAKLDRLLAYWKAHLADLPALVLPTDFARPSPASFRGAIAARSLAPVAVAALKSIGRRCGTTAFVAYLTVFAALVARLSGQQDFAIGTPVVGRRRPELQPIIGFFANLLVMRVDTSGEPDTLTLIARIRDRVLEALEHQELPFEKLVDALGAPRDPSRNPLFQVAFVLREPSTDELAFDGASVRRVEPGIGSAKFDLTVSVAEGADGTEVIAEYCADLFERATVERMLLQYARLLDAMAADPERPVTSLPLMDDATRENMHRLGNLAVPIDTPATTLHRRFAAQAAATPDRLAIGTLDYRHLDAGANRLAHELRAGGARRGTVVAVARSDSADLALAWLAVAKAGAAYLPIDPDLPSERIASILDDAGAMHAIVDVSFASRLPRKGMVVVCPELDADRIAGRATGPPDDATLPEDPAYVIYTSGSTGGPKGVVIPHRAVTGLVCGTDYVQLGPGDVVGQLANPAFDASTFEIWGPLLNGGRIAPIPKATAIAPRALAASIAEQGVTVLFLTTALFNAVAREAPHAFRACRAVLFGGEAVEPRWVRAVLSAGPPQRLLHVYGPTQTTTVATWQEVQDVAAAAATVPIGRPIAGVRACVVRADLELAAPGEPGEIVIGGNGVALGYLNHSELDAGRFLDGPAGALPEGRWYRSGDRARPRDDGTIEFLGRADRQVKLRGHRVELEEIEAAIARLPQVRAAVVSVRGEASDTRQLVAHLVRADATRPPPPAAELLGELRRVLPGYMVPTTIVWLQSLPLNASGKIDRNALPPPDPAAAPSRGVRVAPRDMFEQLLAGIWEELLGVRDVGAFDRFFDLGGHSLLAARLVDAIEHATGLSVPLTALFTDDSLSALATALRRGAPNTEAPILAFNAGGARPPFVFLHGDFTGGGFYSRALAHALAPDQPVLIVHPHGLVETTVPESIEAMAADRIRALRAIRPAGPYVLGGHCNGALVAFEMARQLGAQGERVPSVIAVEAVAPGAGGVRGGTQEPTGWVAVDRSGTLRPLTPRDRQSDLWLRHLRAIERYAGGAFAGHVAVVRTRGYRDPRPDLGWSRHAANTAVHILPGDHLTLVTRHVAELAQVIRRTIEREPRPQMA